MVTYTWTCPLGHHTEVAADVGLGAPSTADRYCPHVNAAGSVCYQPMQAEVTYHEPTTTVEPHPSRDWPGDLDSWRRENGYVLAMFTDRGEEGDPAEVVAITTTATGQGQLILGNTGWVTERFTYLGMADAVTALVQWKLAGWADEPQGWHRHQPSDRRRTDGDPDQEYIAP
jgi:hypothetical protein